uniref:Ig-like domain-containing protein n=1 Tax=Salmo trutta TaxID=8032 RepID=A0A674CB68_SALTR
MLMIWCIYYSTELLCYLFGFPVPHETVYVLGCLEKTKVEAELQLDGEEVVYADFQSGQEVWTLPEFLGPFPKNCPPEVKGKEQINFMTIIKTKMKNAPESTIYPRAEEELGVENTLICFANHFYPPPVKVNWTKNGLEVTEGASLSRYYPNEDGTFHQFSSLSFTPQEGDVYGCTVEHTALEDPKTRFWENLKLRIMFLINYYHCNIIVEDVFLQCFDGTALLLSSRV